MTNPSTTDSGTRSRILRAAIELIAEVGADGLRTRAVAERAAVNPALVHYYFGSMSALIDEAVNTVMAEESRPFIEAVHRATSARSAVEALFEGIADITGPSVGLMVSIDLLVRATRDPETGSQAQLALEEFRELILGQLVGAREAGEIGAHVDLPAAATLLIALFDGLGMHLLIDPETDVKAAVDVLVAALFRAEPGEDHGQ
jgi:AcrR family transcriptional regulator